MTNPTLKQTLAKVEPAQHQAIKEAYYKAVEGLAELAEQLEQADADLSNVPGVLLDEHFIVLDAMGSLEACDLGKVL